MFSSSGEPHHLRALHFHRPHPRIYMLAHLSRRGKARCELTCTSKLYLKLIFYQVLLKLQELDSAKRDRKARVREGGEWKGGDEAKAGPPHSWPEGSHRDQLTGRRDSQGDHLTGGGSRKSKGLRRDSESSRSGGGLNCDLLSLATVRSHSSRGGRFQGENNSSDKEEGGACLIEKEGSRWWRFLNLCCMSENQKSTSD